MKLNCSFEAVDMDSEIILVPIGDGAKNVHGVLKLNEEGKEIIDLLVEETSKEAIINALAAKYDNSRNSLISFVQIVLDNLRTAGLLDE